MEVAARLRRLHDAESVLASRHGNVLRVVARDLEEDSAVGPAFVGLPGGVQEARAEAEARRHAPGIARDIEAMFWQGDGSHEGLLTLIQDEAGGKQIFPGPDDKPRSQLGGSKWGG